MSTFPRRDPAYITPPEPEPRTCAGTSPWGVYLADAWMQHRQHVRVHPHHVDIMLRQPDASELAEYVLNVLARLGVVHFGPCPNRGRLLTDDDLTFVNRCWRCGSQTAPWVPERPEGERL